MEGVKGLQQDDPPQCQIAPHILYFYLTVVYCYGTEILAVVLVIDIRPISHAEVDLAREAVG